MRCFIPFLLVFGHLAQAQDTLYVNSQAIAGKKDGTSWADGYLTIHDALKVIDAKVVKVMGGIYFASDNNEKTESLVVSHLDAIIGGFGVVNNQVINDPNLFPTIVDGDIGILSDSTDNTFQLLRCSKSNGNILIAGLAFVNGNGIAAPSNRNKGGAIWIDNSNATANIRVSIQNCTFNFNRSQTGGAIYFHQASDIYSIIPVITLCDFNNNFARFNGGGAIYCPNVSKKNNDSLHIQSCIFQNNFSGENGGAIMFSEVSGYYLIDSCDFTNNYALSDGAAIVESLAEFDKGTLSIRNCNFLNNFAHNSTFSILRQHPEDKLDSTYLELIGCNFVGNISDLGDGGAIYYYNTSGYTSFTIERSNFENNKAQNDGGAIYIETKTFFKLSIDQTKFINNRAAESGTGGIFYQAGYGPKGFVDINKISITNSIFARNRDAIAFNNGSYGTLDVNVYNSTFFKNENYIFGKSYNPASNYIDNYAKMFIRNCVIWEPKASISTLLFNGDPKKLSIKDYFVSNSSVNLGNFKLGDYNADFGGMLFYAYPLFKDTASNDFSLLPCSPGVNKGNTKIIDSLGILYDIAGNPRIYQDSVDMGAYESQTKCTVSTEEIHVVNTISLVPNLVHAGTFVHITSHNHEWNERWQVEVLYISAQQCLCIFSQH